MFKPRRCWNSFFSDMNLLNKEAGFTVELQESGILLKISGFVALVDYLLPANLTVDKCSYKNYYYFHGERIKIEGLFYR